MITLLRHYMSNICLILMVLGGGVLFTGCKNDPINKPQPPVSTYSITVNNLNPSNGSVIITPGKMVNVGTSATITFKPLNGYQPVVMLNGNSVAVPNNTLTVTTTANITVSFIAIAPPVDTLKLYTGLLETAHMDTSVYSQPTGSGPTLIQKDPTVSLDNYYYLKGNQSIVRLNTDPYDIISTESYTLSQDPVTKQWKLVVTDNKGESQTSIIIKLTTTQFVYKVINLIAASGITNRDYTFYATLYNGVGPTN